MKDKLGTLDDFKKRASDPNLIHFMGMVGPRRPGVIGFITYLEYMYFPPYYPKPDDTDGSILKAELKQHGLGSTDDFNVMIIEWQEMVLAVVSIPKDRMIEAQAVAKQFGLRVSNGIPMMIGGKLDDFQRVPFPNYENVHGLENIHGHLVYTNDQEKIKELLKTEDEETEELVKRFYDNKLPDEWKKAIGDLP